MTCVCGTYSLKSKWGAGVLHNLIDWFISFQIKSVPTQPIEGQKTGTSGLRKKV